MERPHWASKQKHKGSSGPGEPTGYTTEHLISAKERGSGYVEEQSHGSADDRGAETTGGRTEGGRRGARGRGVEAHDLRLERRSTAGWM